MVITFKLKDNYFHLVILINLCFINKSAEFNLETRLPLIKRGHADSYFGYSVAAHKIQNEITKATISGLLLVGAPLDQNLQPGTNKSGALWKCPLTNLEDDCIQVVTDGRRDLQDKTYIKNNHVDALDLSPPGTDEVKNGQWLGVTVRSQGPGEKVLVCAHRYISESIYLRGLCYILRQDLEFEQSSEPCKGKSINRNHLEYGLCQSGTSGMIFEDDNIVIGSPGPVNWRGAITVFSVSDEWLQRDKIAYMGNGTDIYESKGKEMEALEKIKKNSYLGMSVTAGYFMGNNTTVFVAGAPRGNEVGQVVLFVKGITSNGIVDSYLKIHLILYGEQIASNFGYQVATADVNGDKLPDLIVSAPFYFNAATGEGGAVYIYLNDPETHLSNAQPVRLTGKLESRFGFSITSMGDLNKDGFDDLAIGAPYEGNGVVYIYLGSEDGIITKPSQIIKAEKLSTKVDITTFGYSLSGGIDLDENGYPDLLIGAYEKDVVVLLRARPIIGISTFVRPEQNFTNLDPNVQNCLINNTNYISCFSFETCCVIDSVVNKTYRNRQLYITYQLEAETFEKKSSRIWFDDFNVKSNNITKTLTIANSNLELCQKHTAYLKENTQDIQSPIKIRMSYKLIHKDPEQPTGLELPSLDNYPILNQQQADKIFEATFLKDCGLNDFCESKLVVKPDFLLEHMEESSHYQLILGESKKLFLNVTISNRGESAYETKLYVEFPKPITFNRRTEPSAEKNLYICHSQNMFVECVIGNPFKQHSTVDLQLEFDLRNVDNTNPSLEFKIFANTTSADTQTTSSSLTVHVVEKTMLSLSGNSMPEEVPALVNTQLKGESAIRFKEEIGSKVTHHYTIFNNGSWRVTDLYVEIEWPIQVADKREQGKWLLYIDDYPIIEGGTGRCEISSSDVNPLKLIDRPEELNTNYTYPDLLPTFVGDKSEFPEKTNVSSNAVYNRVRRSIKIPPETYRTKDGKTYEVVKMNCLLNSAKCHKFSCYLDLIESKQFTSIIIKSRLWDATLIEDYSDVDRIKIASRAKMHISQTDVTTGNIYADEFQVETTARISLRGHQPSAPIPFFFIIAAILIGLLLFILLTLLLWKLGFFKRRRPDPTLSGNLEKNYRLVDS